MNGGYKIMKKLTYACITLLCIMFFMAIPTAAYAAEIIDEGSCGDELTWALYDNGVLNISGTGLMESFSPTSVTAWHKHRNLITDVEIEDGATSIGRYAFYNCDAIKTVSLGADIEAIGDNAFYNCTALETLTLPDVNALNKIGEYAFYNCDALTVIPAWNGVTVIGNRAFYDCDELKSVTLGSNVKTIGDYSFGSCEKLTSFKMNDVLETVGELAFNHSPIGELKFPSSVTTLPVSAIAGDAANNDPNTELKASLGTVTWPAGIAIVPNYQFDGFSALTTVTIPMNVTTIGQFAFRNCSALDSTKLSMPTTLEEIQNGAFYNCDELAEITFPDNLKTIGPRAFYDCDRLESVTLGSGAETIGDSAFYSCDHLVIFDMEKNEVLKSIGELAFGYSPIEELLFPDSVVSLTPNAIQSQSSSNPVMRASLKKVHWPAGVPTVPAYVFYGFSKLTNAILPEGVEIIEEYAFYNCAQLKTLALPGTLDTIARNAFENCDALTALALPDEVTSLGNRAFYDCDALKSVKLGRSVKTIGASAFYGCDSLASFKMNYGLKTIGSDVFFGSPIEELIFPDSISSMPGSAIQTQGKANVILRASLKKVHWPAGVPKVPDYVFSGFTALEEAELPYVGEAAFPYGVTTIGSYAFSGCTALSTLSMPDSLYEIGDHAFDNCDELAALTLPDNLSLIGQYAFRDCDGLESVALGTATETLGAYAFYDCDTLSSFAMNDGLKTVGAGMFVNSPVVELVFPDSVTALPGNAIQDYAVGVSRLQNSLRRVHWPAGVTSIPESVFADFGKLEKVELPEKIAAIEENAFHDCAVLKSLVFPASIKRIDAEACSGCTTMTAIGFSGDMPTIAENAFAGVVAEVRFPGNNNTYTASNMINYSGKLTWLPNLVFVSFDSKGGTTIENQMIAAGDKATRPVDPKKEDHWFLDWYSDKELTVPYDFETPVLTDITLYARWAKTDFILPEDLTTIEEEAFAGGNFACVVLSENTNTIGERAFADCPNLVCISMMNPDVSIDDDAFGTMTELFMYGLPESTVQTFAENHEFVVFKPIS